MTLYRWMTYIILSNFVFSLFLMWVLGSPLNLPVRIPAAIILGGLAALATWPLVNPQIRAKRSARREQIWREREERS